MATKVHLVVIDPQNDFMNILKDPQNPSLGYKSALPVEGANDDMDRLAAFINKYGNKLDDIHVTMDSHQEVDIAHPAWWRDASGKIVAPFTLITADDIEAGIYSPRDPGQRERSLSYVKALEAAGKYKLFIWPPHCRIGTWGHGVQENLMDALLNWQVKEYAMVNFVTKGTNPFTEHYGAVIAEVPDPEDPGTQLNNGFLEVLQKADVILVAGEALSHCVKETINQIVEFIGPDHVKKIKILTDCSSPVGQAPGGPDFPQIAKDFLRDVQKQGVELTTTTTFFK